jgi:hypothetical protein
MPERDAAGGIAGRTTGDGLGGGGAGARETGAGARVDAWVGGALSGADGLVGVGVPGSVGASVTVGLAGSVGGVESGVTWGDGAGAAVATAAGGAAYPNSRSSVIAVRPTALRVGGTGRRVVVQPMRFPERTPGRSARNTVST